MIWPENSTENPDAGSGVFFCLGAELGALHSPLDGGIPRPNREPIPVSDPSGFIVAPALGVPLHKSGVWRRRSCRGDESSMIEDRPPNHVQVWIVDDRLGVEEPCRPKNRSHFRLQLYRSGHPVVATKNFLRNYQRPVSRPRRHMEKQDGLHSAEARGHE